MKKKKNEKMKKSNIVFSLYANHGVKWLWFYFKMLPTHLPSKIHCCLRDHKVEKRQCLPFQIVEKIFQHLFWTWVRVRTPNRRSHHYSLYSSQILWEIAMGRHSLQNLIIWKYLKMFKNIWEHLRNDCNYLFFARVLRMYEQNVPYPDMLTTRTYLDWRSRYKCLVMGESIERNMSPCLLIEYPSWY